MGRIVDFLFWWVLDPRDDWPHAGLILLGIVAWWVLVSSAPIIDDLRSPPAKRKTWRRPARPGLRIVTYLGIGLVVGAATTLVLPRPAAAPTVASYLGMLVTAIVVGVIACGTAHERDPADAVSPYLVFWEYVTLVAGVAVMRLAL